MASQMQAAASRRRTQSGPQKEEPVNLSAVQQFIDAHSTSEVDNQRLPQGGSPNPLPGQMGQNMDNRQQGYTGPGAEQLHEALAKARAGVNEPGPPAALIRRMATQKIKQMVQPDVADMAARYGVIPHGPQ